MIRCGALCVWHSMPRTLSSLARRLCPARERAKPPDGASVALRRRVLANVRGEDHAAGSNGAQGNGARSNGTRANGSQNKDVFVPKLAIAAVALAATALAALLALAPFSQRRSTVRAGAGAGARAYLRRSGAHQELIVSGMGEPPIGEVYEVWLNRGGAPRPTNALFTVTSAGNAAVEVPGRLAGVREVMVTAEPLGGSASPTSAAVLRVAVARGR